MIPACAFLPSHPPVFLEDLSLYIFSYAFGFCFSKSLLAPGDNQPPVIIIILLFLSGFFLGSAGMVGGEW